MINSERHDTIMREKHHHRTIKALEEKLLIENEKIMKKVQ